MLSQRMTLGPALIVLLVGLLWLDEWVDRATGGAARGVVTLLALAVVCALAAVEVGAIARKKGAALPGWVAVGSAWLGLAAWPAARWLGLPGAAAAGAACMGAALLALGALARRKQTEGATLGAGGATLCAVYAGLLPGFMEGIRWEWSAWALLGVLLVTKSCDIGAYFVGTTVGRHKLIPWLSPGKTWEGLFGGVGASVGAGIGLGAVTQGGWGEALGVSLTLGEGAVLGAVFGVTGQVGDLLESMLKRDAGLKDSGRTLPGFGGTLDVIDSPLLACAAAYGALRWMG